MRPWGLSRTKLSMKRFYCAMLASLLLVGSFDAKRVKIDYSQVSVPEEGGIKFERITDDADAVSGHFMLEQRTSIFKRGNLATVRYWTNPQIAISPDGEKIAYINNKNNTTNIMVKKSSKGGSSVQRTFRTNVMDFTLSPDGKTICFTEYRSGHYGIYLVDFEKGAVVKQISNGTDNDFSGAISKDGNKIYFHRGEGYDVFSLWSYDKRNNLFSNYSRGMNPIPDPRNPNILYCTRYTNNKICEIWRLNIETGMEEILLGLPDRSFTTPQLSPDGQWLLVTGTTQDEKNKRINTDVFAVRTDGTQLTQLTYHPGNDLSAIWAPDGKSIYFVSERGTNGKVYNVWRMDFQL